MGSRSSKESSSSSSRGRGCAPKVIGVFRFGCLGSNDSDSEDQVSDHTKNISDSDTQCTIQTKTESDEAKAGCCGNVKIKKTDELSSVSSSAHHGEWDHTSISGSISRTNISSAPVSSNQSMNSLNSFRSRFNFIPGNISFRLGRTSSLGSSRSYPISPANLEVLNDEQLHLHPRRGTGLIDESEAQLGPNMFTSPFSRRSYGQLSENTSGNSQLTMPVSNFSKTMEVAETSSSVHHDVGFDNNSARRGFDTIFYPSRIHSETDVTETRHSGLTGSREHIEQNFRFSRTLSVGRLRDRVLRRSSLSDITFCPALQDRHTRQESENQVWNDEAGTSASEVNDVNSASETGFTSSTVPHSLFGIQDYETNTDRSTVSRYQDLLVRQSDFLERRRRMRSQVRALRRLGSRFENLSGHERSCILSGLHRTGCCTCHIRSRSTNPNDETSARASISRIVMLAEALFEVLDDIHQQSVVLSSQTSISSIGSIPAPGDAVESLPVKLYTKSGKYKTEDAAQCYICLLEYEEGDSMRILPCQHEFHKVCIDKWLKEIHRVCPLCRGDICRSNPLPGEV